MASSQLEFWLFGSNCKQMDISRVIFVQRHGLEQNIVTLGLRRDIINELQVLVNTVFDLECVWIHLLANFTLEFLPVPRSYIKVLGTWWLLLFLSQNPVSQTFKMDETDRTLTFASDNQRVQFVIIIAPTYSTLNLVSCSILLNISESLNFKSLPELLLIQFGFRHMEFLATEVLYSESHTTKLDSIKLLDFIVVFAWLIFQRSGYKPESVDGFLLLSFSARSMIKVITILIPFEQT